MSSRMTACGSIWSVATVSAVFLAISLGAHLAALIGIPHAIGLMILMGFSVPVPVAVALLLVGWTTLVHRLPWAAWRTALPLPLLAVTVFLCLYAVLQVVRPASRVNLVVDQQFSAVIAAGHALALCILVARIRMSG